MNWVTVLWAMNAAACLTLAGIHALIGLRGRQSPANLLFALLATGTAGMAAAELAMMRAATTADYTGRLNWFQGAVWVTFVALTLFVRLHLRAGQTWLIAASIGLRSLVLGVSLASGTSVNFREITHLQSIPFLGESVAVPVGVPNPWMVVAQLSLCLLLALVVEATWATWRRGDRRAALLVGGGTFLFVLSGTIQAILIFWGLIPIPLTPSLFFTGLVLAMGYDLSSHVLDAAQLERVKAEAAHQRSELVHLSRVASLNELSGTLAHELNQPLAIILSNAQAASRLLSRDPPNLAVLREILTDIIAADRRASEVIARMRALLKRGEPDSQPLALNHVVQEALSLLHGDLLERGIITELRLAEHMPQIQGDRIPLLQVVLNLVSNACDAMALTPPEDRKLTLTTRHQDQEVSLSVSDHGCGLPQDVDRIFESFFTTKPTGLGMGLAISRTIVNAHGGRLWAEPNLDRGAVLHVAFPAIPSPP